MNSPVDWRTGKTSPAPMSTGTVLLVRGSCKFGLLVRILHRTGHTYHQLNEEAY